jgi:hypothetical protein
MKPAGGDFRKFTHPKRKRLSGRSENPRVTKTSGGPRALAMGAGKVIANAALCR